MERMEAQSMSRAQLARAVGCGRSLITELLDGKRNQTTYLPEIHEALGLAPPQPPLPSKDVGELSYIWDRLDDAGRQAMIERGRKELDRLLAQANKESIKKQR